MASFFKSTMSAACRLSLPVVQNTPDRLLLNSWREAPLTCVPQKYRSFQEAIKLSPRDCHWKVVAYREVIAFDTSIHTVPSAMACAKRVLLRFENVFPPSVAVVTGDWQEKSRQMQVGDRFVQRVDLLPFGICKGQFGQRCMDEVAHVYDNNGRCGLAVVTTDQHDEIGEHTIWIRSEEGNQQRLVLESVSASTFKNHVFGPGLLYARWLQRRAHALGREFLRRNIVVELNRKKVG